MDHSILHSLTAPVGFLLDVDISGFIQGFITAAIGTTYAIAMKAAEPLEAALGYILYIPILIAWIMTALSVMALDLSLFTPLKSTTVYDAWEVSIYVVNILSVFIIIFIALANSLRINIETYEIKKTLPNFILSIILANLSFLICKFLLDFSDILLMGIKDVFDPDSTGKGFAVLIMQSTMGINFDQFIEYDGIRLWYPATQDLNMINSWLASLFFAFLISLLTPIGIIVGIMNLCIAVLVLMIPALLITFLAIICLARNIVLYILIAIMPIIIVLYFFPPTKSNGQKLLSEFFQWLFLGPAIYFILGLGTLFNLK